MSIYLGLLIVAVVFAAVVIREFRIKHVHIWLWSYLTRSKTHVESAPIHILFAFCDHFEPRWGNASPQQEDERVDRWCSDYPKLALKHKDADGCHPKHSFFFPEEEYKPQHIEKLAGICAQGFGEVEIHIHHDNDTAENFTSTMQNFLRVLDENHGVVPRDPETNEYRFAFIHGNWALDNSRLDGRWCGINNELKVLADLGCYADFTLPSAPSETQTSKINSIYYATGRDGQSKSHNDGVDMEVGKQGQGDLLIIQGPLGFNWKSRKYGLLPRIENADIRKSAPPTPDRVDLWVEAGIHVRKKPDWRFIKIHTHGTQEGDLDTLLGQPIDDMFSYLEEKYNDGNKYVLHYVSAREMYNIAIAAEAGEEGDPGQFRDYRIPRPPILQSEGT